MFKGIRNGIAARLSPTRAYWSELKTELAERLRAFRQDRSSSFQQRMENDFDFVMTVWGVESFGHLHCVIMEMKMRCVVLAFPILVLFLLGIIWPELSVVPALAIFFPPCLFGIATSLWRLAVLRNRTFIPFHRWLLNPLALKNSRPKE